MKNLNFKRSILLLIITLLMYPSMQAQIAITTDGSAPDGSAMLDVKSTDKGILIPRMTRAQRDGISSPAAGLMVFQTDENAGFYYYDGTSWKLVGAGLLGINDLKDGSTVGKSVFLGTGAGANEVSGTHNVGIGQVALKVNSDGSYNTAIGGSALYNNTAGNKNTAIGYQTGLSNTGSSNVFLGYKAGYSETTSNKLYIENSNSSTPLIYGEFDNDILSFNAKVGIGTNSPAANLDIRSPGTDDSATFIIGNSDGSHKLIFFPGRENDPNPSIRWKEGDPLMFSNDPSGRSVPLQITSDGRVMIERGISDGRVMIGRGISTPDESALLEVQSNSKGFLPPRMTDIQRNAISNPGAGLMVWCNNCGPSGELQVYNGTEWVNMIDATATVACGSPVTDIDGNTYNTVQIGSQCWMAENLNVGTRIDHGYHQRDNNIIEKYCYDDDENNCLNYGGLYDWSEMMQYVTTEGTQGICPAGWHLPTDAEWKTLEMELGMSQSEADAEGWRGTDEGGKLKEVGTTHWHSPNTGATNSSGFTALPGGGYIKNLSLEFFEFSGLFDYGIWWSTTADANGSSYAFGRFLNYENDEVRRNIHNKENGHSVRCLRD